MQKKIIKLIASFIVIILLNNISGPLLSYAVNNVVEQQETEVKEKTKENEYVDFDVYYEDGTHSKVMAVEEENENIIIKLELKNIGYMEDGFIDFSKANILVKDNFSQKVIKEIKDNIVYLNRINGGEDIELKLAIHPNSKENVEKDFFDNDNEITFAGTFVNEKEKETKISETVVVHTEWNVKEAIVNLSQNVTKYVPFQIGENAGILLQTSIQTQVENSIAPVKDSHLEIAIPKIASKLPESVSIVANSTKGTNGKANSEGFNFENWVFDKEKGTLTIDIHNKENENGNISWRKNEKDEFNVIYVYSKDVLEEVNQKEFSVILNTKVEDQFYNNKELKATNEDVKQVDLKDQIGYLVDVTAKIMSSKINKGYLYNHKETMFGEKYFINISDTTLIDEIHLNIGKNILQSNDSTEKLGNFINKTIVIDKEQMLHIVGKDGKMTLEAGEKIIELNYETASDESGKIVIDLNSYERDLLIHISKPVGVGMIEIGLVKALGANHEYSVEEIKGFEGIKTNTTVSVKYNGSGLPVYKTEGTSLFDEPTSKATASINKNSLSTVVKNENVEILAILETDSIDDVLYKNPKMAISFPSYVTDINITNCKSLYSEEIKIDSVDLEDTENGKVVVIKFDGTQTVYNDETTKGINIVLNADITVDRLSPSREDVIGITYSNENDTELRSLKIPVKFVAPIGIVTVSEIIDSDDAKNNITLINGKNEENTQSDNTIELETYSSAREFKIKGQVINNYRNSISGIKILGNIPNEDVKGDTFTTQLMDKIEISGKDAKVYYSANAEATSDITKAENGWYEGPVKYSAAKKFLIVYDGVMEEGSGISFSYDINVPANLSFNNTIETGFAIKYNNDDVSGSKQDVKDAGRIILTTGEGPNLEVTVEAEGIIDNQVNQGQYVVFNANIKNIGTDADNVKVAIDEAYGEVKKYASGYEFVEDDNIRELGTIKAGDSKNIQYILQINQNAEISNDVDFKVSAIADRINTSISGIKKLKVGKGWVLLNNIISSSNKTVGISELIRGEKVAAGLIIKNTSGEKLENITVNYNVSQELQINEAGIVDVFDSPLTETEKSIISEDKHTVKYVIDSIEKNQTIIFKINAEVIANGANVTLNANIEGNQNNNWKMVANTQHAYVKEYKAEIKSVDINSKIQEVKEEQEISYLYTVKNTGDLIISLGKVRCELPSGLSFKNAEIGSKINDTALYTETKNSAEDNIFEYEKTFLEANEELTIKINAVVDKFTENDIKNNVQEKELSMKAKFIALGIEKESEVETYYAVYTEEEHATYEISGKVWKDENKNNRKDSEEVGIGDIQVALFDAKNMQMLKKTNGENLIVRTLNDGTYQFTDLESGKYLVAYIYDIDDYELSQYQKDNVISTQNSDAVEKNAKYNGENRKIALTDIITITDTSARNIDLGLIEKDKFDLNLENQINKITVNTEKEIKEYNYENKNEKLAKVNVNKTNEEENKTMIVEYKVNVTNKGNVSGYANKIVNYVDDELKFNSELNPDWYVGQDGNVYSTALEDEEIKPGETKTLSMILTKTINSDKKEIVNNKSEISEEYNEQGIESVKQYNVIAKDGATSVEIIHKKSMPVIGFIFLLFAVLIAGSALIYVKKDRINDFYVNKIKR